MRERHKHWYEIRAWADGWEVEWKSRSHSTWLKTKSPSFECDGLEFRVVPDSEGWLPWYGEECPVDGDPDIELKFSDGSIYACVPNSVDWVNDSVIAYRIIKEADPYAELKAAAKDPTKQIKLKSWNDSAWADAGCGWVWVWNVSPENYEIRDKPKTKKVKLWAWVFSQDGELMWRTEDRLMSENWKRVPSEDKEIEVEE